MSSYCYFPNNVIDINDRIQAYMISCKIFLQLMVTVFKQNLNLQLPPTFYSSIRFVFETVFISKQIAENRFGDLLEISDKFISKFNVFSYMILQFRLKAVWKILKPYCITLKIVFLLERSQSVPQKLGMKLLEMGKDMKIKHSVSSPLTKYG